MASGTPREAGKKSRGERLASQLGILGQAGCVEDGLGFSAGMFAKMLDIVPLAMRHAFGVDVESEAASRMTLASAGAAFGDHVAVVIWLRRTLEVDFCEDDEDATVAAEDKGGATLGAEDRGGGTLRAEDKGGDAAIEACKDVVDSKSPATRTNRDAKMEGSEGGGAGGGGGGTAPGVRRETRCGLGCGQLLLHTPGVFRDGAYQASDSNVVSSASSSPTTSSSSSSSSSPSSSATATHRRLSSSSPTLVPSLSRPTQTPPSISFPQAPFHNAFHTAFSRAIRRDTRGDLESARLLGATMCAVSGGRRAGCERVAADSTHLIVFSWGESPDAPDPGVLRDAWNRCGSRHKLHLRLSKLDLDLHRFAELEAGRRVALAKRASTELAAARLARGRVRTS